MYQWRKYRLLLQIFLILYCFSCGNNEEKTTETGQISNFVVISKNNPAYFELSDGSPWIPIGINMIHPNYPPASTDSGKVEFESWMKELAENGGNYIRVWLSQDFWDIEPDKAGEFDMEKAGRIDWLVKTAKKYGLRIKMTFEHFRSITPEESSQGWARKSIYHVSQGGPLEKISDYITTEAGHKLFLDKLDFYRERYGSDTVFFGWELWNEMNAMVGPEDSAFFAWNELMLGETKKRFPENLVMQSLGSFDRESVRPTYRRMMELKDNQVAQIHRYLDPGADMEICQAPMDIIASSAIEELKSYDLGKPCLLAETGGVEPRHTGPIRYYKIDTAGMMLHDVLFAPFFSGSAGTGMNWHWNAYVEPNHLWYHFGRFAAAVKGIDPVAENFQPEKTEDSRFRIYMLRGEKTTLLWIRDRDNTWKTELEEGKYPQLISGEFLDAQKLGIDPSARIRVYDPWKDRWSDAEPEGSDIPLPDFRRSLVIRAEL